DDALHARPDRLPVLVDDLDVPSRQRDPGRPRLDRQHGDTIRIAKERAAGLGLPHVVDDGDAVLQQRPLQPLPGRRVEDFAGAHHTSSGPRSITHWPVELMPTW